VAEHGSDRLQAHPSVETGNERFTNHAECMW
jgi:hypothetical protein